MLEEGAYCAMMEVTPVKDKQTRAQSIQGRMAMKKVFFPERAPWWGSARDELLKFPNAQHDDFVDALAYVGLGLNYLVGAQPIKKESRAFKPNTFGSMFADSNRLRRAAAMKKAVEGW